MIPVLEGIGRHQGSVDPGDAKKGEKVMRFASDWSNAKAVHRMEFKKASADIAKQKKLIKKAGSGSKKGAVTIDQIESILDSLEQVSAVKKKKTGLQGSFINIEKILKQMKKMRSAKINPYKGGGKNGRRF